MQTCIDEASALAFIAGTLPPEVRTTIENHIDDCASCRRVLAALMRTHTPDVAAAAESVEWLPGARVGRYVIRERIGRGGMGTVYRADDVELVRPVALKRLHAGADEQARARLVREARAAAQLQHPNVIAVLEVGEHAGMPFLAMEMVEGTTLTEWLKTPRPWRDIVAMMAQAGRGLVAAHERGLVHRDFKPDNVLVDRAGRARVADFGLARAPDHERGVPLPRDQLLARMTATGALAGTPAYLAPEVVGGAPPDARSDQYAFAVALYEALRGQHPFKGQTAEMLWNEMAEGRIREGGRPIPAWLDRYVRRGLAVEPAARWPDLASFIAAIDRPPRRALPWLAGIGVAGALAMSGLALVAARGHGEPARPPAPGPAPIVVAPPAPPRPGPGPLETVPPPAPVPREAAPPPARPRPRPPAPRPAATLKQAVDLFLDNRYADAVAVVKQVLARTPDDPDAIRLVVIYACYAEDEATVRAWAPRLTPIARHDIFGSCERSGYRLLGPYQRGSGLPIEDFEEQPTDPSMKAIPGP
ncbi:MAG TPA: serine/threonine-protein kinase [Kofleriaceae bacterium]|nr:serine/threonine-protein kinase [Kofleriaceae bacterium]